MKQLLYIGGKMEIGYARVSTSDQDHQLQINALTERGCERIFMETASGAKTDRPELAKALDHMRAGDTLYVWRLDRLGRSLKHLIEVVEGLKEKDIGFVSITEGFDTTTNGGRLVFHIFASLADFERNLIGERTKAGLVAARARGRHGGRPEKLNNDQIQTLKSMYDSRLHSIAEIGSTFGISRPSVYRYLEK